MYESGYETSAECGRDGEETKVSFTGERRKGAASYKRLHEVWILTLAVIKGISLTEFHSVVCQNNFFVVIT